MSIPSLSKAVSGIGHAAKSARDAVLETVAGWGDRFIDALDRLLFVKSEDWIDSVNATREANWLKGREAIRKGEVAGLRGLLDPPGKMAPLIKAVKGHGWLMRSGCVFGSRDASGLDPLAWPARL